MSTKIDVPGFFAWQRSQKIKNWQLAFANPGCKFIPEILCSTTVLEWLTDEPFAKVYQRQSRESASPGF
jgi:hypothetical protein